jgi:23S rRNA (cytidine1920-2'-O)/16S rRNA (cytidine1409-2'-O)-methyltransferase
MTRFVSRGGEKLDAALTAFAIDVAGRVCVDFGSHVGGFVDCLLQRGATRVHAVEPGRGVLHARLRSDPRVVLHEGTNALTWQAPEPADLVTVDAGWTPQRLVLPAARRALQPGGAVITLVKPQYEADKSLLRRGVVPDTGMDAVLSVVRADALTLGWRISAEIESPLAGHGGNREFLWMLRPA